MGLVAMGGEKPTKQPNSLQTYANLKHRNHIQRLSLVKSMCVLIHIKFGTYCLSLCSGLTVITHLDKRSAIGLCLPGTWITMTSMLKMAVISQMFFMAQVARNGADARWFTVQYALVSSTCKLPVAI